jgi:hypothetical protein
VGIDVLFVDADVAFLHNPFQPSPPLSGTFGFDARDARTLLSVRVCYKRALIRNVIPVTLSVCVDIVLSHPAIPQMRTHVQRFHDF